MKIVAITQTDADVLDSLNALLAQLNDAIVPLNAGTLDQIVASECCTLYAAISADAVIGCLTLVIVRIPSRLHAWIEDVVVTPSARRQGIGEALIRHAIAQAKTRGAERIGLSSSPGRIAANRLYQKIGFQTRVTNIYQYPLIQEPKR